MRRGVMLVLVIGLTCLALGACGGSTSSKSDATDAQYVDALTASLLAAKDTPKSVDETDARCLAEAIVSVYGADGFEHAKLSVKDVRNPKTDLGALSGPTESQARRVGVGVQACNVGDSFASALVQGLNANKTSEACLTQRLNSDEKVAPYLGASMVTVDSISEHDARALIDVLVDCVDLGSAAMSSQSGLKLTDAETTCVNAELERSEVFKKFETRVFAGRNVTPADMGAAATPALTKCLTPERLRQLGVTKSGG